MRPTSEKSTVAKSYIAVLSEALGGVGHASENLEHVKILAKLMWRGSGVSY